MNISSPQWWKREQSHRTLDTELISSLSHTRIPSLKQLKYLPKLLSPKEKIGVYVLLVGIALNVLFLGGRVYDAHTVEVAKRGGSYTEGLVGSAQYINPILFQNNDADRDLVSLIYSGLVRYDVDRKLVPDLAERYEISADQKTYTFYLRPSVLWQDGTPFTADDVVFTFSKIQDPKVKSPLYLDYKDVQVVKKDDSTIQFILQKPFAPLLDLATRRIVPQHVWADIPPENYYTTSLNLKPIGTGQWKFKSLKKDKDGTIRSLVLVRNESYFGDKPYLDKLSFKFYPDVDSAIQALKNRNVEGISFLPRELRDKLVKDKGLQYYTFHLPQYTALFFNQSLNADLKSKAVRQALAYAVDKDSIIREVLAGEGSSIAAPILPEFIGYHDQVKRYDFNQTKSLDLLQTAGWKKNAEGHLVKEGKKGETPHRLAVTITTVSTSENKKAADIIKDNWSQLGVETTIQLVDVSLIKSETIDSRNYQALLYGEIIGSDPDLYPFWHSSQSHAPGLNLSVFSDQNADKLLEAGRQTADVGARTKAYVEFQNILAEEVPAIFLYNPSYNYVVASTVRSIQDHKHIVYPSDRFLDIAKWYTKSRRIWKKEEKSE